MQNKIRKNSPFIEPTLKNLYKISAELILPIINDEKLIGIMIFGQKNKNAIFSDKDIVVLNILADNTALALENARHIIFETKQMEIESARSKQDMLKEVVTTMSHQIFSPLNSINIELMYLEDILMGEYEDLTQDYRISIAITRFWALEQSAIETVRKVIEKKRETKGTQKRLPPPGV